MKTLLATAVILVSIPAATAFPAAAAAPVAQESGLVDRLAAAIDAPGWGAERWSVLVVSLDGGDTLFAHRPGVSAPPASNLKLFTTAAAMQLLGPEYRYSTFLTGTGPLEDGVLQGDLYVYGTGDPTISDRFFESKTAVWEALADSLLAAGVTRIAGDLVGDASYFEGPAVGRGWQTAYVTHTYAAATSALSFNENIVTMRVTPGDAGGPPNVQFIPGGSVDLQNQAQTVSSGRGRIRVEREGYDAPLVLTGQMRRGEAAQWRAVPVTDPPAFAVSVLEEVFEERGITVDGRVRAVQEAGASPITGQRVFAPATDEDPVIQVLAVHRSPPLFEILKVINQRSHNLYADAVLRTVGRVATGHGSVEGGQAAVRAVLAESGVEAPVLEMDDGSGLSRLNRTTAGSIVALLAAMAESPYAETYEATLPEAATSRGLRRMQQTDAAGNLRAKTGTIEGVSALSGYVRTKAGERLAFAILSHDVPSTWKAKRVEDRIGAGLASFDRPVPTGSGRPALASAASAPAAADSAGSVAAEDSVATRTTVASSAGADTVAVAPEAEPAPEPRDYVIKRGDTLEGIARANDTSVRALRDANPGVNPRRLIPGRSLTLPDGG
jgi:D-alanyl-D-alanine carboxypeptidase/D-alanyl-D-alanine-endopeptidase (penicillin-binding protein 4)